MKKVLSLMAYITMISQIINTQIPILNAVVAGYTVKYLLYYSFIFISLTLWIGKKIIKGQISTADFLLIIFVFMSLTMGIIFGWSRGNIIADAVLFLMPVSVYAWCETCDPKIESFTWIFSWTLIASAVTAILVATRVIETDIWAAEGMFVRSAGVVDSTVFIGGIIILSIKLFVFSDMTKVKFTSKILYYTAWMSCFVGTFFCQSRTRLILMLSIVIICMIYNFFRHKSKYGNLRLIFIGCLFVGMVFTIFPEITNQIFDQATSRFIGVTSGGDINVISRNIEMDRQLELFYDSPVLGHGFGVRSSNDNMYVHNIYTSLLMIGGVFFAFCYLFWLCYPIKISRTDIKRNGANEYNITCLILTITLLVLGYTNAGILQSGGYMSAAYAFIYGRDWMQNERRKIV